MNVPLEHYAGQLSALASPARLAILRALVQGDPRGTPVGELQAALAIPWSTLSHHLERLSSAGLARSRPDGRFVYYSADYAALQRLTSFLWEDCCRGGTSPCGERRATARSTLRSERRRPCKS